MTEQSDLHRALDRYVRACDALRSARAAARGDAAGKRIANLRGAVGDRSVTLEFIATWAEDRARAEIGAEPRPEGDAS